MTNADRAELLEDDQRYERELVAPTSHARRAVFDLPTPWGGRATAESLVVRDVQTDGDPKRCSFFNGWAQSDTERCLATGGFEVLCVWIPGAHPWRIILARPDSEARLTGLTAPPAAAETTTRAGTGQGRAGPPRPGYDNSDPGYDGPAHHDTTVDSPPDGPALAAGEVERILLAFGRGGIVSSGRLEEAPFG